MIRRLFFMTALLLAPSMHPGVLAADEEIPPISVKSEVDRAVLTIGDPVQYSVIITHAPDVRVLSSIPAPASDIFKVKKIEDIRDTDGSLILEGKKFTLTAYRLGEFVLDPVEIQYRIGAGDVQTTSTQKIYLRIKSIAEGEAKTDIRGVKPVIQRKGGRLWLWLLLALIFGAIGWMILRRQLARRGQVLTVPEEILSPEERALRDLNALFSSDLLRKEHYREYYLRLSEVLRVFLEGRFGILAVESTTMEIEKMLKQQKLKDENRRKIVEVLDAADLAKFAKWRPQPAEVLRLNKASENIVNENRAPREEVSRGV